MFALLFGQSDALAEEIDGGIAHQGAIEFEEPVALFVFLLSAGLLIGMACSCNLGFALSHIAGRLCNGLVYLLVARHQVHLLGAYDHRKQQQYSG